MSWAKKHIVPGSGAGAFAAPPPVAAGEEEWVDVKDVRFEEAAAPAAAAAAAGPGPSASDPPLPWVVGWRSTLSFSVNGKPVVVPHPSPTVKLVDFLRGDLGLTGTKVTSLWFFAPAKTLFL